MSANSKKSDERYPNRFKPGQSGNPKGRPKRTKEQIDALAAIEGMTGDAVDALQKILHGKAPAAVKLKAVEVILDRVYGKSSVKVDAAITPHDEDFVLRIVPDETWPG